MNVLSRLHLVLLLWLGLASSAFAQSAPFRYDLLALLPDDFAVCIVMHDLRGQSARWERSDWLKTVRQSHVGKSILESQEMQQLVRVEGELKKHFDIDWPTLRDDILGDTLILSYAAGASKKPENERGLFLLHVRQPERLLKLIDKLNQTQKKGDDLKLANLEHKGQTYFRRTHQGKTQYYFVKDSLAVVATKEDLLQACIERRAAPAKDNLWAKRFEKAGADSAFLTMCVNPRMLDAEVLQNAKKGDPLPGYWKALDAIFVTFALNGEAEFRIAIQAKVDQLPAWAKGAFTQTMPMSSLWQRFPEQSILTIASKTDFEGAADALKLLMLPQDRVKLDALKDILPNIGPDWGLCILPSQDAKQVPQAMFALEVKQGKDQPIDLFKGVQFFAGIAVAEHNKKNPGASIRMQSVMQGKVEVQYLTNDKLFPPGFQPACALKDGFLVFATSPDAIKSFRFVESKAVERKETPLMRLSAPELAKLLEHRRAHIFGSLTDRQQMSPKDAKKNIEDVIAILGFFDQATVSQRGGDGQANWIIRLTPARTAK